MTVCYVCVCVSVCLYYMCVCIRYDEIEVYICDYFKVVDKSKTLVHALYFNIGTLSNT